MAQVVVPRTPSHFDAITAYNNGVPPASSVSTPPRTASWASLSGAGAARAGVRLLGPRRGPWGPGGNNTMDTALIRRGPTPDCLARAYGDAGLSRRPPAP
ncbi:MAG: hypothetical protein R3F43_18555 [bacterium]